MDLILCFKLSILKEVACWVKCVCVIHINTCDQLNLIGPQLVLVAYFLTWLLNTLSPKMAFMTERRHRAQPWLSILRFIYRHMTAGASHSLSKRCYTWIWEF